MLALITGSSRGIGAETAKKLAASGMDIALTYHGSKEKAEEVVQQCLQNGIKVEAFKADISQTEDCQNLVKQVQEQLGPINVLVNNAGITDDTLCLRMKSEQFERVITTNLSSMFTMSQLVLAGMLKQRFGRIINLSSVAGLYGNAGQVNYSAAKAGVIGLTKALAKEVGSRGVTVNAVAPGFITTDMTEILSDKIKEIILDRVALKRAGKPEEVAELIAFLASEKAAYITGQVIEISGGMAI